MERPAAIGAHESSRLNFHPADQIFDPDHANVVALHQRRGDVFDAGHARRQQLRQHGGLVVAAPGGRVRCDQPAPRAGTELQAVDPACKHGGGGVSRGCDRRFCGGPGDGRRGGGGGGGSVYASGRGRDGCAKTYINIVLAGTENACMDDDSMKDSSSAAVADVVIPELVWRRDTFAGSTWLCTNARQACTHLLT